MKQWRLINLWPGRRIPMPMYYFHLRDQDHITDVDGTDLADIDAAREHADTVARELTFKTTASWARSGRNGPWLCTTATA
jgi:hypothetical protein